MSDIIEILNKCIKDKKLITIEVIKDTIEKIVELNLEDMAKNLPMLLPKLGILMKNVDSLEDTSDLLVTNFLKLIQKLIGDEEIKYELSLTPNIQFNLTIGTKSMGVEIKDGNINFRPNTFKPPNEFLDFAIEIPLNLIPKLFTGEDNLMVELMAGERIKLWRERQPYNAGKLFELMPLITIILEKLNLDKWL